MKNFKIIILALVFTVLCASGSFAQGSMPFFVGEKITYAIKKMGLKAGQATLEFHPLSLLDGKNVYTIIFRAKGFNFYDEEKIYLDHRTYKPIRVERDLNIFGNKEKITEYYEPGNEHVRIVKKVGKKITESYINKKGTLDNIYCFIYRVRKRGAFEVGDIFNIHLPTQDVRIRLMKEQRIGVAGKKLDSYYMQSDPSKYRIWFGQTDEKIPLRIDGAVGFGRTSMFFRSISEIDVSETY